MESLAYGFAHLADGLLLLLLLGLGGALSGLGLLAFLLLAGALLLGLTLLLLTSRDNRK